MDILFTLGSERELDRKLDELVAPILKSAETEPAVPEFDQLLRALRLVRGPDPRDINARILRTADGSVLVSVGGGLYDFLRFYAQCVVAKLYPDGLGGTTPSAAWSVALPALASSLEWLALPIGQFQFPELPLSPKQDNLATVFGNMAYRAAICHEIAHAMQGHHNAVAIEGQQPGIDDRQKLLNAREREIQADVFGMELQLYSLPDPGMSVIAADTIIYNVHATNLLRFRLMALAEIIDVDRWTVRIRHPDSLMRFGFVVVNFRSRFGDSLADLMSDTHNKLEAIDGEIRECMVDQRESVRDELLNLARSNPGQLDGLGPQLDSLFNRSPVGVIRALDILAATSDSAVVAARLVESMPRRVQRFVALPSAERTGRVLNQLG